MRLTRSRMRSLLADDLRAFITNRDGGVDKADAEEYLRRVAAMNPRSAQLRLTITQMVTPRPDMVIAMVQVNAARGAKTLHNPRCPLPVRPRRPWPPSSGWSRRC